MIKQWLRAGVVEHGRLSRREEGTPQGGPISPVLLNVALHGMESAAGVSYTANGTTRPGSPVLIRYADDMVALCHSRQEAIEVKARLAAWLAPRGLAFNEDKTHVVTLDDGFDFLGVNVRRYHGTPLIKPSAAAIKRIREQLRAEMRSLRGTNVSAVIKRLNPHHPGLGGLLPDAGLQRDVQRAGCLPVDAHLQVGETQPPEQVEALDHHPVLRQVRSIQARPVGVRQPPTRRVPPQVRLDHHHPTPDGEGRSVARRLRADRVLDPATTQDGPADQQHHPVAPSRPGWSLPDLQGRPLRRRRPTASPARMGTLAGHHPHRERQDLGAGNRHVGRG